MFTLLVHLTTNKYDTFIWEKMSYHNPPDNPQMPLLSWTPGTFVIIARLNLSKTRVFFELHEGGYCSFLPSMSTERKTLHVGRINHSFDLV